MNYFITFDSFLNESKRTESDAIRILNKFGIDIVNSIININKNAIGRVPIRYTLKKGNLDIVNRVIDLSIELHGKIPKITGNVLNKAKSINPELYNRLKELTQ